MPGFLEDIVANALQNALGNYFVGVEKQRLKVDVFSGHIELKNLPVREDALSSFQIPYRVRWGMVAAIILQQRTLPTTLPAMDDEGFWRSME